MSYAIYDKQTTKIVRILKNGYWQDAEYKTPAAAKAAFTRLSKQGKVDVEAHDIAEIGNFRKNIEKTEVRNGAGPAYGQKFIVAVNTPWTSGPWSETYWSA
jgi:hypothetical protein